MIAVLSPAKRIEPTRREGLALTLPAGQQKAGRLAALLREYAPWQLESVLRTGPALALAAYADYQRFDEGARTGAAALSYRGLAFGHLSAGTLDDGTLQYAQEHLRILSALYGPLRPLDEIAPYRLDFLARLKVQGESLYRFWGRDCYEALFRPGQVVVNLASAEYAKTFLPYLAAGDRLVTCEFLTRRRGRLLCLATEAKMARGEMARFLLRERLERPDQLQAFAWEGYTFSPEHSSGEKMVFLR